MIVKEALLIIFVSMFLFSFNLDKSSKIDTQVMHQEVADLKIEVLLDKKDLKVLVYNTESTFGEIVIYNKAGNVLKKEMMELNGKISYFTWYSCELESGEYIIELTSEKDSHKQTFKI